METDFHSPTRLTGYRSDGKQPPDTEIQSPDTEKDSRENENHPPHTEKEYQTSLRLSPKEREKA